jgi:NADH:ubiquinone oxidoreductase subunit 4 (subunit M)
VSLGELTSLAHPVKYFLITLFVLEYLLVLAFSSLNLLVFYRAFEGTIRPRYYLIGL